MADHPILFSAPMVRALLAGTKTQTRRIAEPVSGEMKPGQIICMTGPRFGGTAYRFQPKYAVGDRLWVREHWRTSYVLDCFSPKDLKASETAEVPYTPIRYEADGTTLDFNPNDDPPFGRFRPSMFLPRWASRITLTVTDVRVERLQNISEADAVAEGVERLNQHVAFPIYRNYTALPKSGPGALHSARLSYSTLWNSIKGPGAWDANPWVAAYTFAVGLHNIDAPNVRQIGDE